MGESIGPAFLATLKLVVLLTVPGCLFFLALPGAPRRASTLAVASLSVSLLYVFLLALALLHLGRFHEPYLWLGASLSAGLAVVRHRQVGRSLEALSLDSALLPGVIGACLWACLFLATPRWNFLISFGMDAGNYENYSNHFWRTGSLYLEYGSLIERGIPREWISFEPDWDFSDGSGRARPLFFLVYPVLLGVAKELRDAASGAWILGLAVSSSCVLAIHVLTARLVRRSGPALALTSGLCLTPLFFYYSKQIMSEQVALFGVLAFFVTLTEERAPPYKGLSVALGSSLALALLTKLDALTFPVFLLPGLAFAWLDGFARAEPAVDRRDFLVIGATVGLSILFICGAYSPEYLTRYSVSWVEPDRRLALVAGCGAVIAMAYGMTWCGAFALPRSRMVQLLRDAPFSVPRAAVVVVGIAWIAYAGWNVSLRPAAAAAGAGLSDRDTDELNFTRLLWVFSPVLLSIFAVSVPLVLAKVRSLWAGLLFASLLHLSFLIWDAHHGTVSVMWWMRRYLVILIPAVAIGVGGLLALCLDRFQSRKVELAVSAALLLTAAAQAIDMRPLLEHAVNPSAPRKIATLLGQIPKDAALIVPGRERNTLGLGNTLRHLHDAPTLLTVPYRDLGRAIELWDDRSVAVLSSRPLGALAIRRHRLEPAVTGEYGQEWQGLRNVLDQREPSTHGWFGARRTSTYHLYVRR